MAVNRKTASLFALALLLTVVLSACSAPGASGGSDPLVIMEWPGYEITENPSFGIPFSENYDVNEVLEYSFFVDDAEAISKVLNGVDADLIHPCASWWELYVENDLVEPIDTSRLSNWDQLNPAFTAYGNINGTQYFIPYDWGYEGLMVRTDLVENVPQSWADLLDPQYAGQIAFWDSAESAYMVGTLIAGIETYPVTEEKVETVRPILEQMIPQFKTYWSDTAQARQLIISGDAAIVTHAWPETYSSASAEVETIDYVLPGESALGFLCGYGILKTNDNLDLSYEFLDAIISAQSGANFSNAYYYGHANLEATSLIDPYVVELMSLDDPASFSDRTLFYATISEEERQLIANLWSEVKASQ